MKSITATKKQILLGILGVILLTVFDQYTKYLATVKLKGKESFIIIKDVFQLTYLENRGAAFGMMQNKQIFFIILTLCFLVALIFAYLYVPKGNKKFAPIRFLFVILASGALGNFIDRATAGFVVDFFDFCLINFPIFNVADCYVVISAGIFLILGIFVWKEEDYDMFSIRKKDK